MRYLPYDQAATVPNIIVDGSPARATLLTLSHWPRSGTPSALGGDTSTEIVFNYLDTPAAHVPAEAVSNNHFDEDGLLGMLALIDPALARRHRPLMVDAARAGDFEVFATREGARVAFVISAHADVDTSPFGKALFDLEYPELSAELYRRTLALLPSILADPDAYRSLWEPEDARLSASEALVDRGLVTIEERPDLDLAIVRLPDNLEVEPIDHFARDTLSRLHPSAIYNRTRCSRVLLVQGGRIEFRYRYESWVQMRSRRPLMRVDLKDLAAELSREEPAGASWVFDGVDALTPRLHLNGASVTSMPQHRVIAAVERHLRTGAPAWRPYD